MFKDFTSEGFLAAQEPSAVGYVMYSKAALEHATRRAHVVAVTVGIPWSPKGEYPAGVWDLVFP